MNFSRRHWWVQYNRVYTASFSNLASYEMYTQDWPNDLSKENTH